MTDFYSAASRHWHTSTLLSDNQEFQQAAYLAGYAAECSLKALVEESGLFGKDFGHSLAKLSDDGLEMALLLNPLLRRYQISPIVMASPGLGQWHETHRYEKTGFLPEDAFKRIIDEAGEIAELVLVGFTLDGLLESMPE